MKILIYGLGKTGTTALTYAVKNSCPSQGNYKIFFEPNSLADVNYLLNNIIVKSLRVEKWKQEVKYISFYDKKIIIVRHPFDTIISYILYTPYNKTGFSNDENTQEYINILTQKVEEPNTIDFSSIINVYKKITGIDVFKFISSRYRIIFDLYTTKKNDMYLLKYEDFIEGNLSDINQYLGLQLKTEVEVAEQHKRVARTKKHGDWKNWLTENDVKNLYSLFADFIDFFEYSTQLDNIQKIITPENSYLYVINVINEYRTNINLPKYEHGIINVGKEGNYIDNVVQCLRNSKLEKSRYFLRTAFNLNPELEKTYSLLEKRIQQKEKLLLNRSTNTNSDLVQGNQLLRNGKLEEAVAAFQRAIAHHPSFHWSYFKLGEALEQLGDLEEAIAAYRKALELKPDSSCILFNLSRIMGENIKPIMEI